MVIIMVYKCLSITLLFVTSLTVTSSLDGCSLELEVAVSLNDLKTVERLLHPNTINLIVQEREWKTACIAAEKGNLNILEYIVSRNSSILQRKNKNNCTLAHIAAQYDQLSVVAYCLAKLYPRKCIIYEDVIRTVIERNEKRDIKTSELILKVATPWKDGPSCLSIIELAGEQNDTRLIQYIAEEKTSLFLSYPNKVNSLLKIAIEKNLVSQKFLEGLEANHALMKGHMDYSEYTVCHLAAECDRLDIIQFIANRRAESSSLPKANCDMQTVFRIAVEKGFGDIIRYVIGENPSMDVKKDWKTNDLWRRRGATTSALHYAIKKNSIDMDTLKYLVEEKKVPLTITDPDDKETIAHTAASDGKIEILLYLVEKEPSLLTIRDVYDRTVLHILANNYNLSMDTYRFIIQKLANSTERNKLCSEVGLFAAEYGNIFLLMCIVELEPSVLRNVGFNIESRLYEDSSILHMLAKKNTLSVKNVGFFIDKGGSLLMKNIFGDTVVGIEARNGNIEILKYLVERESSSLSKNLSVLTEISEAAARYGHLSVLKFVTEKEPAFLAEKPGILFKLPNASDVLDTLEYLKAMCETKIRNWDSRRFRSKVLQNIIEYNYLDILKYMNYDVNMISKKGEPLIFTAIRRKRPDIFYYLAKDGKADLTALDRAGNNILFIAAQCRDLEKMKYILDTLKVPLEIKWRNNYGDTLLHVAVQALTQADRVYIDSQKKVSEIKQSRECAGNDDGEGTESSSESSQKKVPEKHQDDLSIIEYLVEQKHADINARGHQNKTVLHWAASGGNPHICNYLLDHGADPKLRDQSEHNFWQAARFPTLPSSRNAQQDIPVRPTPHL